MYSKVARYANLQFSLLKPKLFSCFLRHLRQTVFPTNSILSNINGSSTMKAIRVNELGGPSVLKLEDVILPALAPNHVLLQVKAAGVNPVDTYIREGKQGYNPKLPYTPGSDAAGIVEGVGSELIGQFKVGQRVYSTQNAVTGTYAEKAIVQVPSSDNENAPVGGIYVLPEGLSFAQGAAIGAPYFTAFRALVQICNAKAGETVMIHGASGAVGLAACQIARHVIGAIVIGTAGTAAGMEVVSRAGGAHHVVNHREPQYVQQVLQFAAQHTRTKQVDIIIEMLANENIGKDLEMIGQRGGRIAIVGNRGPTEIDLRRVMMKEAAIYGVQLKHSTRPEWDAAADAINKGLQDGILTPVVDRTYALGEASHAHHDIIHSSGAKGRLVILND